MSDPRHIRIFLSSPGDVNDERGLTRKVIEELHLEPLLRDKVTLQCIAWDDLSARTPMLATLTPQEAINRSLPKPSECHIVIVIFWSRMGTPLPDTYHKSDGSRYLSGTEWEYLDAVEGANQHPQKFPLVAVYRRTEKPQIDLSAPDVIERYQQYQLVDKFFEQFKSADGSLRGGINQYASPAEFQTFIENDLKMLITQVLERPENDPPQEAPTTQALPSIWQGSPFPGLRAFTADDEPIFFGRGRETDALVSRVAENRFVGVVGASGSGKSSLVGAGLIPRLRGNAIEGSKDWLILQFTPGEVGDDPFMALAVQLATVLKDRPRDIAEALKKAPDALAEHGERALSGRPDWAELLLFIDQFEELFTLVRPEFQVGFIALLAHDQERAQYAAPLQRRIRIVVTMRSDFYHRCVDHPALTDLLESSTYPLSTPKPSSLSQMITRPAERAGLQFEHGLPERILDDTGSDPGALALMAYLLDEMYRISTPSPPAPLPPGARGEMQGRLTFEIYDSLGGVQGAIGKRAETTFEKLDIAAQAQLKNVFRELVEVDEHGTATRRRSPYGKVVESEAARELVDAFVEARLLVGSGEMKPLPKPLSHRDFRWSPNSQAHGERLQSSAGNNNTLEVAHEALLRSWPTLVEWIKDAAGDLYALRQARQAAEEWDRKGRPEFLLWPHERLQPVYDALANLESTPEATLDAFIRPEAERLLDEFETTPFPEARWRIVRRWLEIGVSTTPQMMAAFAYAPDRDVTDSLLKVLEWWDGDNQKYLLDSLSNMNTNVQLKAIQLLTKHSDVSIIPHFFPLLNHTDSSVLAAVVQFLTKFGDASLIPDILPLLRHADSSVRLATVSFLTKFGDASLVPNILPLLTQVNDRPFTIGRGRVVEFLATHGDATFIPDILALIHNADNIVRQKAVGLLTKFGDASLIPDILPLLTQADDNPMTFGRDEVVEFLATHGDASLIPIILPLFRKANGDVRQEVAYLLAKFGDASLIPIILPLLENEDTSLTAILLLTEFGDASLIPIILPLLEDTDLQNEAVSFLTKHGDASLISHILPFLRSANDRIDRSTRQKLMGFLTQYGDAALIPDILPLLQDKDTDLQQAAAHFLTTHGDAALIPDIFPLLQNSDTNIRQTAVHFLASYGNVSLIPDILFLINGRQHTFIRPGVDSALRLLSALGDASLIPDILPLLRDARSNVKREAIAFLCQYGDATLIPDILPLLRDLSNSVRAAAIEFIKTHSDATHIPDLVIRLTDPDHVVRQAAFVALMKLSGRTDIVLSDDFEDEDF